MKIKIKFLLVLLSVFFSSLMFSASVKVKSPNGGESWQLGSEKLIKWEKSGNFTRFQVSLRKANTMVGDISPNLGPNSTSFLWKKVGEYKGGNVDAGSDYKIRVRGYLANGNVKDDSDSDFTIIEKKKKYEIGEVKPKFKPDMKREIQAHLVPIITEGSSDPKGTLRAFSKIYLKGSGFGKQKGDIVVMGNGWALPLNNVNWSNTNVSGVLPHAANGMPNGTVKVRILTADRIYSNGWETEFRGRESKVLTADVVKVSCSSEGSCNKCNHIKHGCGSTFFAAFSHAIYGFHRNYCGAVGYDEGTDIWTINLKNGWVFKSMHKVEWHKTSENEVLSGPTPPLPVGKSNWETAIHWEASPCDHVRYQIKIIVEGPIGTHYK